MSDRGRPARHTALVTGASSGIGYELARVLAGAGYDVVLVARRRERLEALAAELGSRHGTVCIVVARDLSQPRAGSELFTELQQRGIAVDVLVNNAGFGTFGPFAGSSLEVELELMQVNMVTLTELTRLCLDDMLQRRAGRILNVASTAAFQPGPLMAVYYASKAYVLHFSEALAYELRGTGVTVTALCPGPTTTGFQSRAAMEDSRLVQGRIMDARTVALAGYRGLVRGKPVVIPGLRNKALTEAIRITPRSLVPPIVRRLQERVQQR